MINGSHAATLPKKPKRANTVCKHARFLRTRAGAPAGRSGEPAVQRPICTDSLLATLSQEGAAEPAAPWLTQARRIAKDAKRHRSENQLGSVTDVYSMQPGTQVIKPMSGQGLGPNNDDLQQCRLLLVN